MDSLASMSKFPSRGRNMNEHKLFYVFIGRFRIFLSVFMNSGDCLGCFAQQCRHRKSKHRLKKHMHTNAALLRPNGAIKKVI